MNLEKFEMKFKYRSRPGHRCKTDIEQKKGAQNQRKKGIKRGISGTIFKERYTKQVTFRNLLRKVHKTGNFSEFC